ncbi:MAG TPA: ThuA domain-containing protein [Sedimentisphaerales bacterium]|nr:ThuA domain-containing protein [Sedimentisphaerales bacterium]HNU29338.1 ThuA domain-containing protein [Sedimentisphaerales bacterium]
MKRGFRSWSLWLCAGILASGLGVCVRAGDRETRKVVIVTGNDYPGHKWKETAPVLAAELRKDSRLVVDVVETPDFLASEKLAEYDVAVLHFMNWETPDPGEKARQNLVDFTGKGGGLVAVHFACGAFQGWPEFEKLIGRVYDPNMRGHDPHGAFEVRITDPNHPITQGLASFETTDELYTCLAGKTPIHVLAASKSKVDGKDYAMAFVLQYGKGRVFHSPLGHDVQAFGPAVGELFRRGAAWAAGLTPVRSTGILPATPDHGRDAHATKKIAFLAGKPSHGDDCHEWYKDAECAKQWLQGATNIEPPQIEIYRDGWPQDPSVLDSVDAVVFFADGREHHPLAVPGRIEKMRELAKKGKGIAFLHYSVDPPEGGYRDLLDWMGGSYEVGVSQNPINVAKVTPVANGHPITRGCGGYVAEDEWYFDIHLRDNDANVVRLLTGKLPPRDPQDKVLSWAYTRPDGGRGFGFTGGHFHKNWSIGSFRTMVLNGILWTAGIEVPEGGVASMHPWRFVSIPDFVNADLAYPQPGWEDALDHVLKAIKAENPEFVLIPGDLVMGHWPDKDTIEKFADVYYGAWVQRMKDHGLKFYATVGDHEIGGAPWPEEKAKLANTFRRQFTKHLGMPLNGPLRMRGTAFWFIHENTLFAAVDVFEKGTGPQGGIVPQVTGEQLEWLEGVFADNPGVEHVVVMGHTPILGPVESECSTYLSLAGGRDSPLWQSLKTHGVGLYLCGETHAISCTQADGVLQIAHGSLIGASPKVNYLVATVHPDRIDLAIKEIAIVHEGGRLWQMGDERPCKTVRIPADAMDRGFQPVGSVTLRRGGQGTGYTDLTGCFERIRMP